MTQQSDTNALTELAREGISSLTGYPYLIAFVVVFCFTIPTLPSIIRALTDFVTKNRASKIETEGRQKLLRSQILSLEDKRKRKKKGNNG